MQTASLGRPDGSEYAPYYAQYVDLVPDGDVLSILDQQLEQTTLLLGALPEEKGDYRYEPDKWSVKDIVGHINDVERILMYRALRFARGDTTKLQGFDQDKYVQRAHFERRTLRSLVAEFQRIRKSSLHFFEGCSDEELMRRGQASGFDYTVRAFPYILAGHELHHVGVLQQKYL